MTPAASRLPSPRKDDVFSSYVSLAIALVPSVVGIGLFDAQLRALGQTSQFRTDSWAKWLRILPRHSHGCDATSQLERTNHLRWTAIPMVTADGTFHGFFCASQRGTEEHPAYSATRMTSHLNPLLDCVRRDLVAQVRHDSQVRNLTERSEELEWLFKITGDLRGAADDRAVIEALLQAAGKRLKSARVIVSVPDKHLTIIADLDKDAAGTLAGAWDQTRQPLMEWVQRQNRPLVVNHAGAGRRARIPCKVMCVPVNREGGKVIGVMAFYNPPTAPDFAPRHVYLARHIGRQAASLIEAQFDLMTGLYTRSGLDQMFGSILKDGADTEQSIIYLDIDHMRVANEMHGFELGNELIIRVADLLSPPLIPQEALGARISGDRFAIVLPRSSCEGARLIAERLQEACSQLLIGPTRDIFDVSITCGISILLPMPDGLARAIAAAEIACKTAKSRGRSRVEIYKFEDGSMMRRHKDALAVGQLRSALKSDRLALFAQRIAPLQNRDSAGGYELLLRIFDADGAVIPTGPLIEAAQRFRILPSIDRWVIRKALQTLGPFRGMLKSRGLNISMNVSGQSMGDEAFAAQLIQSIKEANLPAHCLSIELTEQAAISNLERAKTLVKSLAALGCRLAMDDFGTGSNSLAYLKALDVYRVKIDGSFIRDLQSNRNSRATVNAIVELARGMGIESVAEYFESQEVADTLKGLGVDYAQGYAVGKPEPLDRLLRQLAQDESARLHKLFLEY